MPGEALSLDAVSIVLIWTAIALYALAFVAYAFDLARRSSAAVDAQDAAGSARLAEPVLVGAAASGRSGAAEVRRGSTLDAGDGRGDGHRTRYVMARIGTSLTVLGFAFHFGAALTRGIAAGRVPWSNMYEFAHDGHPADRRRVPRGASALRPAVPRHLHHRARRAPARRGGARVLRRDRAADGSAEEHLARHPRLRRVARHGVLRPRLRPLGAPADADQARDAGPRRRGEAARRPHVAARDSSARCRPPRRWRRSPTASRSSASSSGPSPSSPARSGRRTPGDATGASTPKKSGRS